MDCRYCGASNGDDDHRCRRCGRRLKQAAGRPGQEPITTATVPSYAPVMHHAPEAVSSAAQARPGIAYQRPLFHEIPQTIPVTEDPVVRRRTSRPARKAHPDQQSLDFLLPQPPQRAALENPVVGCGVPVAGRIHRMLAVALDLSIVAIAFGIFLITFSVAGGSLVFTRETTPLFAVIAGLLAVFYHVLFCLSGGDSPGMRWTSLRVLNFDGHAPTREQRAFRLAGSLLSLLAAGLGLLWSLVDEESLTWHDHMSKTFPSPYDAADVEA